MLLMQVLSCRLSRCLLMQGVLSAFLFLAINMTQKFQPFRSTWNPRWVKGRSNPLICLTCWIYSSLASSVFCYFCCIMLPCIRNLLLYRSYWTTTRAGTYKSIYHLENLYPNSPYNYGGLPQVRIYEFYSRIVFLCSDIQLQIRQIVLLVIHSSMHR